MSAKVHAPTSEQLRIAQLLVDKSEDNAAMREKCQKIMETTGCSEGRALTTLHDCNNSVEDAVLKIIDGSPEQVGEWTVAEARKSRKSQQPFSSHKESNIDSPSNDDFANDESDENQISASKYASRRGGGVRNGPDGPPRLRGRGGGPMRGGQTTNRRPRGGGFNDSNDNHVNYDEHSSERGRRPGRFNGTGRDFGDRGRGRGAARGGRGSVRKGPDDVNEGGMATWNNEQPESNTWDNSMANNKWSNGRPQNQQQQQQPIDEWKGVSTTSNMPINAKSRPTTNSNTWDNSMAQSVVSNSNAKSSTATQQQPTTNQIDEWTPDDWGGEEDWHSIKDRVFESSKKVGGHSSKDNVGMQSVNNSAFNSNVTEIRRSDQTGIPSQMRIESADKTLFVQKTNNDANIHPDVSTSGGSWCQQAADNIKNELGIGKVGPSNLDQSNQFVSRDPRHFGNAPIGKVNEVPRSRVEMPNSVNSIGQIDVEFGEFPSKLRSGGIDTSSLFEFGSTAGYNSSDLSAMPAQSTKDHNNKNMAYQRAPSAKDSSQINGGDILSSSSNDVGVSKSAADMLSQSYPNAANTFISSDHQQQYPQRSSSLLGSGQQQKTQTGLPSGLQTASQQQRSYLMNNQGGQVVMNDSSVSQMNKDVNLGQQPTSMQTGQNIAGMAGYNVNVNRNSAVTSASKMQVNPTVLNQQQQQQQQSNQSYQQALAASMPYICDQSYLNAFGILSPPGIPFNTLPFDLSSLSQVAPLAGANNLRDAQGLSGDVKQQQYGRNDANLAGANSINAPPGLGPANPSNAEQAAQLMTPAAYQYPLMNPQYFPFVVPTVTNSSAPSTASSGNPYKQNSVFSPVYFPSGAELMQVDYAKNLYQSKQANQASNLNMNSVDVGNKSYPGIKTTFEKSFQNTATPPPGIGNVFSPNPNIFNNSAAAFGAYPAGYLPQHVNINMMPPNIAQAAGATMAQNDVISGGSQRPGNQQGNKSGGNIYGGTKPPYWPNS